jgi:hypothetical protein
VLIGVDVVCGPLLTLILANPDKSLKERCIDFGFVGLLQILALAYGFYVLYQVKPVAIVFEVDRLVLVSRADVDENAFVSSELKPKHWWSAPALLAIRDPKDGNETLQSIQLSMQGIEPSAQPDWWAPIAEGSATLKSRMHPLQLLESKYPDNKDILNFLKRSKKTSNEFFYLPFTTGKVKEWVVVFDADAEIVGYLPLDGF